MLFYPKIYVDTILDVKYEYLQKNNIHAIILDMDNTLIDFNGNILKRGRRMVQRLKRKRNKIIYSFK